MLMEDSEVDYQVEKSEIAQHFMQNINRSRAEKALIHEDRTEENLIDDDDEEKEEEDEATEPDFIDDDEDEDVNDDDDDDDDEDYDEEEYDDDNDETEEEPDMKDEVQEEEENDTEEPTTPLIDSEEETSLNDTTTLPSSYEPFFPELSESTDVPILLLKTTIVSNVDLETKTLTSTKLRTYTFVVTRVAGNEEIITSTTEVKPQIQTATIVESLTRFTTLTLLDLDNMDKTEPTFLPTLEHNPSSLLVSNSEDHAGDYREEARNLATRVMSNGVEVIVASDKSTYPGDKDYRRVPNTQKPVTLKPSTLTDHMLLVLPQETSSIEPTASLDPNQFVVKTCLTTFTYLTTYLEKGTTTVSSHEQVVSNVATEERMNTGKILPTPAMGVTLTQHPNLSVGVFHTTYTYLNTILDGEQPLVISSQHVVANTVTAPDDYLSLLKPSEVRTPVKNTNTYFSTINLEKTMYEDGRESVISTREVVTQVVITESIPARDTPVATSYVALDVIQKPNITDVTKTYFVTYTYFNTVLHNGSSVVYTNISTESDVVTEKVPIKNTIAPTLEDKEELPKFDILATRTYFTTFTYFTTLLKENDPQMTTIINSRTKVVENLVTETLESNLFDPKYLSSLSKELKSAGADNIVKLATLLDGQELEVTLLQDKQNEIQPTAVLPISKTDMPQPVETSAANLEASFSTTKPNVITGSTIVFIDDDPFANLSPTPSLQHHIGTQVVKETKVDIVTSKLKRPGKKTKVNPSKSSTVSVATKVVEKKPEKNKKTNHPAKITSTKQPAADLLGLGSINIDTLQALTPVLSAMAGYINKNLKSNRRNDVNTTEIEEPITPKTPAATDVQNRSPVYIPVGGALGDDFEIAESQNIASFDWTDPPPRHPEAPLLGHNGIPISPGDIITANSDVIVGKPGRVGPRLPSAIPLSPEVPLGMKPPPPPPVEKHKSWKNKILPVLDQMPAQTNVIHAPNKDDYVGPPPPIKEKFRGEKRKHIPLTVGGSFNIVPQYSGELPPPYQTSNNPLQMEQALRNGIHKNFEAEAKKPFPIAPSIPIVLPEVIERSTGQPLLVQLQPSQVAFVNIPFNRTTALIYGGSTETHHNGQYFDDPSPFLEPEFNPMENSKGVPQIYRDTPQLTINQKQVSGVIKVVPQVNRPLKIEPDTSANENLPISVTPVQFKVPSFSFEMAEQHGEVNAHIINHDEVNIRVENSRTELPLSGETGSHVYKGEKVNKVPLRPKFSPKRRLRPSRPSSISEFMTPPPVGKLYTTKRPHFKLSPPGAVKIIPLVPETNNFQTNSGEIFHKPDNDNLYDEHLEDDLPNEDGEVIQESNPRPLKPGEVPIEVLRKPLTTERTMIRFPDSFKNTTQVKFPYKQQPEPDYDIIHTPQGNDQDQVYFHVQQPNRRPVSSYSMKEPDSPTQTEKNSLLPTTSSTTTTQKPVLIYIGQKNNFFNKKPSKQPGNVRPQVTSLPIDSTTLKPTTTSTTEHHHSQTEKQFDSAKYPAKQPTNEIDILDSATEETIKVPSVLSGEDFVNLTQEINNMEVLQPPKVDVRSPGKDILRVPQVKETFISQLSEEMLPPPPVTTEIVLGMNPPPLVSTHKPVVVSQSAERPNTRRPLRPRRPGYRRTTTTTTTTSTPSTTTTPSTRKSSYYGYYLATTYRPKGVLPPRKNISTTTPKIITPTPTLKQTPSLEVIVGQPHFEVDKRVETTTNTTTSSTTTTNSTPELVVPEEVTLPVHHAGNEVKIVDEPSSVSSQESSVATTVLPTRYITHTKTHTVTITKTTVVKTLGGPPSTITLLVTKTEKSYIVDTVTEFHTLVKPTSIVETVTTTVEKSAVVPTPVSPDWVKPTTTTTTTEPPIIISSVDDFQDDDSDDDSLEDFIIKDTDSNQETSYDSNESIFVVMTDKNKGTIIKMPPQNPASAAPEVIDEPPPHRDEITDNEVSNNILLGGILSANHAEIVQNGNRCVPECKPSRNELCQKVEGVMRCVCRPGFARMFPDRPCNPTYTYSLNITIEKVGKYPIKYSEKLSKENSTEFVKTARKVHEALDRMVMQSDLRDIYHGVHVTAFYPKQNANGVISKFYLQLSDNIDETRMEDVFKKYLRGNNYSLGGTDVFASSQSGDNLSVQDFNECDNPKFHDCSDNSQCFNLRGTYTCSCKEGYSDLSENMLYPGRICSAEQVGCEKCNYHGTCYSRGSEELLCECFHWYAGEYCQVNLKVLLIALVTLGTILFALLLVCIIMTCVRKKPKKGVAGPIGFLPQRGGTLDRRAIVEDTSSEDSRSETNSVPPYVQQKTAKLKPPPAKGALKKISKVSMTSVEHTEQGIIFPDQKDRSLTVMIPRAKYHPAPPTSPLLNYTTFDARKPSVPAINTEAKLLSYLDAGPSPSRSEPKRKFSNALSEQLIEEKSSSRKTSGALVSAGFEVSATVVNTIGTLGTTCGTEADRSENATLIQKISADLLSRADTSSQFNTLRKSIDDDDLESNSNWMDIPRISAVSEARSYDETTIPPPMKSFTRSEYDSKSLQNQNDEANTMAERDLGSTFLLPHTHLYKPDRGSDISGFESL
ncbi:uncharacterized protein LOC126745565 [Anthonomus grandis grandis]|uniref:uncharacterized protein LOC126745565 n=1 Tax=Anthonomus grandis grandis TaxID=2921223 RepID=UPI0021660E64|nr:uncharacterized protein LOC126745565 [Anthonomus grandis grandis]